MQDVAWFLWLHTLVPVYGSYHLFLLFQVGSSQMQDEASVSVVTYSGSCL